MAGFATKEEMEMVVARWIDKLKTDEKMLAASKDLNVTIGYVVDDLGVKFHTDFVEGKVDGGLGEADPPSMMTMDMSNETFDGLWTGEVDAEAAVMSGEMGISGDMNAAMGLQALFEDMARLYNESKAELAVT